MRVEVGACVGAGTIRHTRDVPRLRGLRERVVGQRPSGRAWTQRSKAAAASFDRPRAFSTRPSVNSVAGMRRSRG